MHTYTNIQNLLVNIESDKSVKNYKKGSTLLYSVKHSHLIKVVSCKET